MTQNSAITTIQVSKILRDDLKVFIVEHGAYGETYDSMIRKIFEAYKRKR